MWFFVVCTHINNEYASLLFSQAFFRIVSAYQASLQKLSRQRFRFFDIVVKNKSNVV